MDGSSELQLWINQLKQGNLAAREKLLQCAQHRLRQLAGKMLHGFPRVGRWAELDDIVQDASVKLWNALKEITPGSVKDFIGLAALQIRRVLIDMARRIAGPDRKHFTPSPNQPPPDPSDSSHDERNLASWTALHEAVARLPDPEREVFDLHWYQGLTLQETADMVGVSIDTIKRRWQSARLLLYETLKGDLPKI